ncbi:hypothetical protein [Geotalea uraniireducens]|uniref:hypothetical protein n=1 Tax=Geotalea uraniireducens TaxID=351604 RepID=UPI00059BB55A|nr:hypothetical protein [Geotalea uraniireducens]
MGRMKESPRYNVIAVRITDEEMMLLKYLSKKRKTTYSQLIREALATADFPSSMITDDDKMLMICFG